MTLRETIEATNTVKRPALLVRVGGRVVPNVLGAQVSMDMEQASNTAAVSLTSRPDWVEESQTIEVWGGYNGELAQIFGGEVESPSWDYPMPTVQIQGVDVLGRVREAWGGGDKTYTSQDDAAVIVNILESYGLHRFNIESSAWTLAAIQDLVWADGEAGWRWIEEIDQLAGYRTFCGPDGAVYRRRFSGAPSYAPSFTYTLGTNMFSVRRVRTRRGIVNKVIVNGLEYEGLTVEGSASAGNSYIPDPPGTTAQEIQSDLVEDSVKAAEIAQRMVGDLNRRPEYLEFDCEFNPLLRPGMTIRVNHSEVESDGAMVLVIGVRHSCQGAFWTTSVTTSAGTLSGYNASAPYAEFLLTVFQEAEDTGSASAVYIARAEFTGFDPDGDESALTFAWSITPTGGTATAITGLTGTSAIWRLSNTVTSITVTLTVTDVDNLSDTISQTQSVGASDALREDLYSAESTRIEQSSDGQQTWNTATLTGTPTATAPLGADWGTIWSDDAGHISASFDGLATAPIDLGQPHGAVSCTALWIHELDSTRLWAGFTDGDVWYGTLDVDAQTASWAQTGTIPEGPVREIRESYGTFGELRATAGQGYYLSQDGGATWTATDTGDTAWRMAAGADQNFYSFLNDDSPLRAENSYSITLPVLSPTVRHIRGLTVGWRRRWLYAVDDQARLLSGEITDSGVTLSHISDAPVGINHMLRSGAEGTSAADIIYLAGDTGILKWFGGSDTPFYVRQTPGTVLQVGYGVTHGPVTRVTTDLLLPGLGQVWYYDHATSTWSAKGAGQLPSAVQFNRVVADPFNRQRWLVWIDIGYNVAGYDLSGSKMILTASGSSPIWETTDGGATWQEVVLNFTDTSTPYNTEGVWAEYDYQTSGLKHIIIGRNHGFAGDGLILRFYGTATTLTEASYLDTSNTQGMTIGQRGETVVYVFGNGSATRALVAIEADGDVVTGASTTTVSLSSGLDTLPQLAGAVSGAGVVGYFSAVTSEIYGSADYHTLGLSLRFSIGSPGSWMSAGRTAAYVTVGADLRQIADPLGSPSSSTLHTLTVGGEAFGHVRAGRRYRQSVGARVTGSKDVVIYDGSTTTRVTGPASPALSEVADWVEVLEQEIAS